MPTPHQMHMLLKDPDRILHAIGAYAVARARRSFDEQAAPDGTPWPQRYPNQAEQHTLNVAGAIADLENGDRIKPRRYESRPAGRDSGTMMNRITYEVSGGEVRVGSDVPYARRFQEGGESTQPLNSTIEANLIKVLKKSRTKAKRRARQRGELGPRGGAPPSTEQVRLGPVLGMIRRGEREWVTNSPPRPFVGLSQQDSEDIKQQIKELAESL